MLVRCAQAQAHDDIIALFAGEMVDPHARSNQVLMALEATGVDVHEEARKDDHGAAKKEIDTKAAAIKAKAEAALTACKECKAAEDAVVAG